jgi:hypothetical protein
VKKLLALAGLASVLALPCAAFADTSDTQCTTIALGETTVVSCAPIADPEAYYYAGPGSESILSSVPIDDNAPNADDLVTAVSYVAFVADYGGN